MALPRNVTRITISDDAKHTLCCRRKCDERATHWALLRIDRLDELVAFCEPHAIQAVESAERHKRY